MWDLADPWREDDEHLEAEKNRPEPTKSSPNHNNRS